MSTGSSIPEGCRSEKCYAFMTVYHSIEQDVSRARDQQGMDFRASPKFSMVSGYQTGAQGPPRSLEVLSHRYKDLP